MVNQLFRNFGVCLLISALLSSVLAQQTQTRRPAQTRPKPASTSAKKPITAKPKTAPTPKPDPEAEKTQFEAAIATTSATEKAELLVKFIADHPKSEFKTRAEESLAGARAAIADERLTAGDLDAAVRLFKLAVGNAPKPYSDRLFSGVIATIPANLYWRGFKTEGIELAKLIETNIASDVNKLLLLSTFYLGSENGDEAKRIAEAAIKLDEKSSAAHQTLATAHRLNFDLESAAVSFARSVELDPESTTSKRSLADMQRALGKSEEAEKIYREILTVNDKDNQARTGLVLALFDLGKRADAEAEMAKALEETPSNVVLLGGAAYWYAANKDGDTAVEYARRAIDKEPRYVWSHIALGRGLMLQDKPVEAERALIAARKYGNFPTLQYEIASARLAAGFFREAVEELKKSFEVSDGSVSTRLGGRIGKTAGSLTDAIDMERRASIFAPSAADSPEDAARLRSLIELTDHLGAAEKDESAIIAAAESFANGGDNMSVHRKLYTAHLLLQHDIAADEAAKLTGSAVTGFDRALDVADPGAAVMASELYEARAASFSRDDFLLIPEVPKQTLNSLMRGRAEEIFGLALLRQRKPEEATVRFRRALTVLPKDSAWWRSATWNLGNSLAAEGKDKEALDTMISSYAIDKPNAARYILIEQLWTKVNGNRDGLEEKIGPNPLPNFAASKTEPTPDPSPSPSATVDAANPSETEVKAAAAESSPTPEPSISPEATAAAAAAATPTPTPSPDIEPSPSPTVEAVPEAVKATATPDTAPSPESTPTPETSPEVITATPTPESSPTPEASSEAVKISSTHETVNSSPTPSETEVAKATGEPKTQPGIRKPGSPLFEPIIITIPKTPAGRKPSATESKTTADNNPVDVPEQKDETVSSPEPERPRIVEGKAIVGELLPCEIGVSQETVSLINNGGSISMLVSIEQGEDIALVSGVSNSPEDIEVKVQSDMAAVSGRSMFVIKSISERTGLYQVTFKAPCGRKNVVVRVR